MELFELASLSDTIKWKIVNTTIIKLGEGMSHNELKSFILKELTLLNKFNFCQSYKYSIMLFILNDYYNWVQNN